MKQSQYLAMMARKRAAGDDMTAKASPLARRIAQIQHEARMDRAAEDLRAEWREDQRDEEFHRYDDRY